MKATLVNLSDHARHCPALPVAARHAPEEVTLTWRLAMVLFRVIIYLKVRWEQSSDVSRCILSLVC